MDIEGLDILGDDESKKLIDHICATLKTKRFVLVIMSSDAVYSLSPLPDAIQSKILSFVGTPIETKEL